MSFADYNEYIQRELVPETIDTVVYDKVEPFKKWFTEQNPKGGDRITGRYRTAHSSNASAYDKSDVDVAPATQTLVKPYWDKLFYQGSCEVHGIDISNNRPSAEAIDMINDQVMLETASVWDVIQAAFLSQIKNDVDSSSVAYSDGSLSRSTHATLASYEESTDATITLAYVRGMIQNVTLNKPVNIQDYVCLMEGTVYHTFKPLAAALHTLNTVTVTGKSESMGYPDVKAFEDLRLAPPTDFTNMTTGDVFMLRRQDVKYTVHRPLEIVAKESGRDSIKMAIYVGANVHVDNPYYQGKMTSKD